MPAKTASSAAGRKVLPGTLDTLPIVAGTVVSVGSKPAMPKAFDLGMYKNGEAREVKRLFVADGSALANALGGPNPTLTIDAVATRTAEKIFRRYFGGDPWVRSERPVSSIDPQVTKAVLARGI